MHFRMHMHSQNSSYYRCCQINKQFSLSIFYFHPRGAASFKRLSMFERCNYTLLLLAPQLVTLGFLPHDPTTKNAEGVLEANVGRGQVSGRD